MNKLNVARVCAAMFVVFAVCLTAYAEDGYIESEGDAYVSLGHCAGPNTKMEVDFQLTEIELQTKPFGSWGDRLSIPMFSLYISTRVVGGKVSGRGAKGLGDFVVTPQDTTVKRSRPSTLTCIAAGAQSYEWYETGSKIDGATNDSYTVEWSEEKALQPNPDTYSVKPIFTVFNERVVGNAVSATVKYAPIGLIIQIR